MHITDIQSPGGRGTELSRTVARLREQEMAFRITHDDLAKLDQIARVSSRIGDASRWTELAVYHRPGENRPYLAVTEGHSVLPGEKLRFQYAAMGTLDRAMNWFEGSALRDELAAMIDRREEDRLAKQAATLDKISAGLRKFKTESTPGTDTPPDIRWKLSLQGEIRDATDSVVFDYFTHTADAAQAGRKVAIIDHGGELPLAKFDPSASLGSATVEWSDGRPRYAPIELTTLTAALTWLYPGDDLSERARALAFEHDFGMPERTVRNTLAIEAGRVEGKVGPWVQPMLVALRFMDRKAWEASRD